MSIKYGGPGRSLRTLGVGAGVVRVTITDVLPLSEHVARVYIDNTFSVEIDYQLFTGFKINSISGNATPLGGQVGENYIDLVFSSPTDVGDPWEVATPINIGSRKMIHLQSGTVGGTAGAITVSSLASTTAEFPDDSALGLLGGDTYIVPASMPHPTYLLGVGNSTGRLYRMAEGATVWTRTAYASSLNTTGHVWSFPNGYIIADNGLGGASGRLLRSTDSGGSFTEVFSGFSAGGALADWSIAIGPSGKALLVEYGSPGRYIYYTEDYGENWTLKVDNNSLPAGEQWSHLHAVHYHAATSKWVIGAGDATKARVFTLDSDGTNLTNLLDLPGAVQPVWFADGVGNEVLFGDDTHAQVAILNVSTGLVRQTFNGWRGVGSTYDFCWHITKHAGVYYAFQFNGSSATWNRLESVLLVAPSPDGPWSVAWVFGNTTVGCYSFAGYFNGLLHFKVKGASDAGKHWVVNPIELTVKGASAANGTRNNTETADSANDHLKWFQYNGTLSTETGLGIAGTNCVKYLGAGNGTTLQFGRASANTAPVTAGKVYQVSCWVKVISNRDLQVQVGNTLGPNINNTTKHHQYCPSGVWTLVKTMAFRVITGQNRASIQFQISSADNIAGDPPALLLDRVMCTEAPMPDDWIAVGGALAETAHAGALEARPKWTDIFWFEPVESHHRLLAHLSFADQPWCIRSWKVGLAIIELWMHAGVKSTLNAGVSWDGSKSTIVANDAIFRSEMQGEILHLGKLDLSAGSTGKITDYDSTTQVKCAENLSARLINENVSVEAPRFELRIHNGTTGESIYSPRIAFLARCGIGFAVQVGGASDNKVRAWVMFGGTVHSFGASAAAYTEFQNVEITTHFGASSLTAERAFSGAVGKFVHLGDFGYVPEDQLPDVIPTGTFDDSTPAWVPNDVKVNQVQHVNGGQDNTQLGWEFRTRAGNFAALTHELAELVVADVEGLQVQVDGIWYSPISIENAALDYIAVTYAVEMDSSQGQKFRTRQVNLEFFENTIGDLPNGLELNREGIVTPHA